MRQRLQCLYTSLTTSFLIGLRQRGQQHCRGHGLQCLGQRLHERQVGIERASAQCLAFLELAHVSDQLINQDHTRCTACQQCLQHRFARRGSRGIGLCHQRVALSAPELPRQISPQRAYFLTISLEGLVGRGLDPIQHRDTGTRQLRYLRRIQNGGHPLQITGHHLTLGHVIDRQHRVRLATAKGRLQLDNGIAAPAR
ncbi:hypothetical protein D9M68_458440 [compost metagenome]